MVTYTRKSNLSGKMHTMTFDLTDEQFNKAYFAWAREGVLIQKAFPTLNAGEREFLMTGITPEEWNETFGSDYEVKEFKVNPNPWSTVNA